MIAAEIEILAHGHVAEQLARLRALHDAATRDRRAANAFQIARAVANGSVIRHESGNRIEERRLARAVQSDDRYEFAFALMHVHAIERARLAVQHADALDLKNRRLVAHDFRATLACLD